MWKGEDVSPQKDGRPRLEVTKLKMLKICSRMEQIRKLRESSG